MNVNECEGEQDQKKPEEEGERRTKRRRRRRTQRKNAERNALWSKYKYFNALSHLEKGPKNRNGQQ